MKKNKVFPSLLIIAGSAILACALLIQQLNTPQTEKKNEKLHAVKNHPARPFIQINRKLTEKITIGAIGDILIHQPVYQDAFNGAEFNFNPMFTDVKALLEKPNFLTANQESLLGGRKLGLSSYPRFNSPLEVADALVANGVDMVSTANNHSLDKGEKGILAETKYLKKIGLPYVGSYASEKDRERIRLKNINGIKIAFLSYTYGTNGLSIPKGKEYLVNLIDRNNMAADIHRVRKAADVVVISIHWGNEYQRMPSKEQKELARFLAEKGVDVIFGSHPHVLQPMEWIRTSDGRSSFVVYSLGNFISAQMGNYKDIGGLATIDITKRIDRSRTTIKLSNPDFYPTFVSSRKKHQFRVVPLEKADSFGLLNANAIFQEIQQHMFQMIN